MSRQSGDTMAPDGSVLNGYDYNLQLWVDDGIVLPCGHPPRMRRDGPCCNADRWQGLAVSSLPGHERRAS